MGTQRRSVIGDHLLWTLYGHWLANDLRGSGSEALRDPKFADLAPVHRGRKPEHLQPSREEVRAFYRDAAPRLEFPRFWIDEAKRQALATSIEAVCRERAYTVWACAILSNHVHMVIRRHREDGVNMWRSIAAATCLHLRAFSDVGENHPVWAARPYKVFLWTPHDVKTRVRYVERNPEKEGLPRQEYGFVTPYDNWPFHRAGRPR
jgi:REP element-mobilizing transposase RayT